LTFFFAVQRNSAKSLWTFKCLYYIREYNYKANKLPAHTHLPYEKFLLCFCFGGNRFGDPVRFMRPKHHGTNTIYELASKEQSSTRRIFPFSHAHTESNEIQKHPLASLWNS